MAEDAECFKNKKLNEYKESVQAIGNSWIICRSQSHSGRIYYFNTLTGKSAWNLSEAEIAKAQLFSREGVSGTHMGDCPEPSEPPVDIPPATNHQKAQSKDSVARIYNKQIINNQFSKPCTEPVFQNSHCHQCSSSNAVNDTGMNAASLYNPAMWAIPPPHQVLLASAVSALANQAQPIFNSPNLPLQNTFSTCFQIGHSQNPSYFQGFPKKKFNKHPARWNQNSQRNFNNSNNDLRDILSSRRNNQRSHQEEPETNKTYENAGNSSDNKSEYGKCKLTAADLDSSDIDEDWLEANTIGDISCAWRECSGADCWIVVANAQVLLNNRKFLSKFIKAEEQIFLLTPLEIIKQLRSATGDTDSGSRLVQRARAALRFAVQQMDKVPAPLKNLQNRTIENCCLELIGQDYRVLFLLDDDELVSQINIDGVSTFTIKQFKDYLNQKFNTLKPGTHENITITIQQNNGENIKTISQSTQDAVTVHHMENGDELNSMQHKEIEIQTEQIMPVKKTVDACIQTDFEFLQSTDKPQSPVSKILKSPTLVQPLNTEIPKSPYLEESLKIDQALKTDAVVMSLDEEKEEPEVATKKIRLNRNTLSTDHSTVKKPQFRWRKQRAKPAVTTTPSPKAGVVSNNQTVSTKSPPSSLISISDLLPPENDNFSDLAKSIDFSEASIEKSSEIVNKVVEESSLDVISNSIDDDIIPKISKNTILNESKDSEREKIVIFEVTSDIMDDYLSRGCDEWLSRFVQIMEEALSQILQQEPSFFDPAMPPPWSVYEAIVCIKTKFKENSKVMFACDECGTFLLKISDSKGKIFADLNPSDFMRLYSYGVHLIEALQSLLNDSEDLQIAKDSLAKLLNDIKNPNLDVAQNVFMDTFLTEKQDHTVNVSELVTDAGDDFVEATNVSPANKSKQTSCEPSPSKYNLRSSQRSNETNEKGLSEDDSMLNMGTDLSFFTTLKLQKTTSSTDVNLASTAVFSPQQTFLSNHSLASGINEISKENEENEINGPKIIRHFNFCSEIEEKLKSKQVKSLSGSNDFDAEYDSFSNDNNYYGNEFNFEDNSFSNSNDKSDSNKQSESEEQYCNNEIGTQILQFVIDRTTYPVHRVLANLQSFCEATYEELYSQEKMDQLYKINLIEKMKEVRKSLNNLRNQLNSVLCRKDTKIKVRIMLEELGFLNSELSDTQLALNGERVQKYLDQANILYESVDLIAAAIREKE